MIGKKLKKLKYSRSSFSALLKYISGAEKTQGFIWVNNCLRPETAAIEMQSVAHMSTRVKNPAVHYVLSWPPNEKPTPDQAKEAGEMVLHEIGLSPEDGYLSMIALHLDTGKVHVHIGACVVSPHSGLARNMKWSKRTLSTAVRKVELKQGWSHGRGLAEVNADGTISTKKYMREGKSSEVRSVNSRAKDIETVTGMVSFDTYYRDVVAPHFKVAVATGSWQKVHEVLGTYGIEILPHGGGYAVRDTRGIKGCNAAAGTAGSWARKQRLETKLGDFAPYEGMAMPICRYDQEATNGCRNNWAQAFGKEQELTPEQMLRQQFRVEKAEALSAFKIERKYAKAEMDARYAEDRKALSIEQAEYRSMTWQKRRALPKHQQTHHLATRSLMAMLSARERELLNAKHKAEAIRFKEEWAEKYRDLKMLSWQCWMRERGAESDRTATEMILAASTKHTMPVIRPSDPADGKKKVGQQGMLSLQHLKGKLGNNGSVEYYSSTDGRQVMVDHGHLISAQDLREDTIDATLKLARAKWGRRIVLSGTTEWRKAAARRAAQLGMVVTNVEASGYWEDAISEIAAKKIARADAKAKRKADSIRQARQAIQRMPASLQHVFESVALPIPMSISTDEARLKADVEQVRLRENRIHIFSGVGEMPHLGSDVYCWLVSALKVRMGEGIGLVDLDAEAIITMRRQASDRSIQSWLLASSPGAVGLTAEEHIALAFQRANEITVLRKDESAKRLQNIIDSDGDDVFSTYARMARRHVHVIEKPRSSRPDVRAISKIIKGRLVTDKERGALIKLIVSRSPAAALRQDPLRYAIRVLDEASKIRFGGGENTLG